jgi:hypothetical protein
MRYLGSLPQRFVSWILIFQIAFAPTAWAQSTPGGKGERAKPPTRSVDQPEGRDFLTSLINHYGQRGTPPALENGNHSFGQLRHQGVGVEYQDGSRQEMNPADAILNLPTPAVSDVVRELDISIEEGSLILRYSLKRGIFGKLNDWIQRRSSKPQTLFHRIYGLDASDFHLGPEYLQVISRDGALYTIEVTSLRRIIFNAPVPTFKTQKFHGKPQNYRLALFDRRDMSLTPLLEGLLRAEGGEGLTLKNGNLVLINEKGKVATPLEKTVIEAALLMQFVPLLQMMDLANPQFHGEAEAVRDLISQLIELGNWYRQNEAEIKAEMERESFRSSLTVLPSKEVFKAMDLLAARYASPDRREIVDVEELLKSNKEAAEEIARQERENRKLLKRAQRRSSELFGQVYQRAKNLIAAAISLQTLKRIGKASLVLAGTFGAYRAGMEFESFQMLFGKAVSYVDLWMVYGLELFKEKMATNVLLDPTARYKAIRVGLLVSSAYFVHHFFFVVKSFFNKDKTITVNMDKATAGLRIGAPFAKPLQMWFANLINQRSLIAGLQAGIDPDLANPLGGTKGQKETFTANNEKAMNKKEVLMAARILARASILQD